MFLPLFGVAIEDLGPCALRPIARLLAYLVSFPVIATAAHRAGHSADANVSRP